MLIERAAEIRVLLCHEFGGLSPYDRIGTPRFPAGKALGNDAGNSPGKVFPEALFEGLPLVLGQSVDKRHDGGFLAGIVCLASLRCLYLPLQALAFGFSLGFTGLDLLFRE